MLKSAKKSLTGGVDVIRSQLEDREFPEARKNSNPFVKSQLKSFPV
jgi:hypothetical protein